MVAATRGSAILTSVDFGASWIESGAPWEYWASVASSADGCQLVAAVGLRPGLIYTSMDSGKTWTEASAPWNVWQAVASSAEGNNLVAIVNGGLIYVWHTAPSPRLNLTPSSKSITLAWTLSSTNFVLQKSFDLTSWTDLTNSPTFNLTNLQNQVILLPSNSSGFYRLKTQ